MAEGKGQAKSREHRAESIEHGEDSGELRSWEAESSGFSGEYLVVGCGWRLRGEIFLFALNQLMNK
jgi:hypothetical protein